MILLIIGGGFLFLSEKFLFHTVISINWLIQETYWGFRMWNSKAIVMFYYKQSKHHRRNGSFVHLLIGIPFLVKQNIPTHVFELLLFYIWLWVMCWMYILVYWLWYSVLKIKLYSHIMHVVFISRWKRYVHLHLTVSIFWKANQLADAWKNERTSWWGL